MASISKVGTKWRAFVSLNGVRKTKMFSSKADAAVWARTLEKSFRNDGIVPNKMTFDELLDRYAKIETPKKRGADEELRRIRALQKDEMLADLPIGLIDKQVIRDWIDKKRSIVSTFTGRPLKTSTIARYLAVIKAVFTKAVDWKLIPSSPAVGVSVHVEEDHRERIATEEEIELLKIAAQWEEDEPPVLQEQRILAAFIFACYTGMRVGEIVGIERTWINGNTIRIPREKVKIFHSRTVALPDRAINILNQVLSLGHEPKVFGMDPKDHDAQWRRLRDRAGLSAIRDSEGNEIKEALNFHDSRATFCTWAASPGPDGAPRLDILALARQTGHKDIKMLRRYYRKDAVEFLDRLNSK